LPPCYPEFEEESVTISLRIAQSSGIDEWVIPDYLLRTINVHTDVKSV